MNITMRPVMPDLNTFALHAEGRPLEIPGGDLLLRAEFSRSGAEDLLLTADPRDGGGAILIQGYFASAEPVDLLTPYGARITGDLAARLAGSLTPGAYAASGPVGGGTGVPVGEVSTVSGQVLIIRANGARMRAEPGTPVNEGDVVQTGPGGKVGLTFADDSTFSLGGSGRMVVEKMAYDPEANTGELRHNVVQGVFSFISGKVAKVAPEAMSVKTPVATLGIRGTTVAGQAAAEGSENTFTLLQDGNGGVGAISVSNAAGTQVLNQINQSTQVTSFSLPPAQPIILPPSAVQNLYGSAMAVLPTPPNQSPPPAASTAQTNAQNNPDAAPGDGEKKDGEGEGDAKTDGEGDAKPEGEGEAKPEGEGEAKPEGEGEAKPEGEGEAKPEGEGEAKPDGEGEAKPDGEGEVKPEGEGGRKPEGGPQQEGDAGDRDTDHEQPLAADGPAGAEGSTDAPRDGSAEGVAQEPGHGGDLAAVGSTDPLQGPGQGSPERGAVAGDQSFAVANGETESDSDPLTAPGQGPGLVAAGGSGEGKTGGAQLGGVEPQPQPSGATAQQTAPTGSVVKQVQPVQIVTPTNPVVQGNDVVKTISVGQAAIYGTTNPLGSVSSVGIQQQTAPLNALLQNLSGQAPLTSGNSTLNTVLQASTNTVVKSTITTNTITTTTITNTVNHTQAPDARNDALMTTKNHPIFVTGTFLLGNDVDLTQDPLSIVSITNPVHGTLSGSLGNWTYTPTTGYVGSDSFTYRVGDGYGQFDTATVTIQVFDPNSAPVLDATAPSFAGDLSGLYRGGFATAWGINTNGTTFSSVNISGTSATVTDIQYTSSISPDLNGFLLNASVDADGLMQLSKNGIITDYGAVVGDGEAFVVIRPGSTGQELSLGVFVEAGSGLSAASLAGTTYQYVWFDLDPGVVYGTMTFNADGTGSVQDVFVSHGLAESDTFTYAIASDGLLNITFSQGDSIQGQVSADGGLISLVSTNSGEPGLGMVGRHLTSFTPASMAGRFLYQGLLVEVDGSVTKNPTADQAMIVLNADGSGYWYDIKTDDGQTESGLLWYSVDAQGKVTVSVPGDNNTIDHLYGFVTAGGNMVVMAEQDANGNDIGMSVMVRQQDVPGFPGIFQGMPDQYNLGQTVAMLLGNVATDTNGDTLGVAVTGLAPGGIWQYSLDGGSNWTTFGTVSDTSATLLAATARVRLVPDSGQVGDYALTIKAWDGSDGHSSGQSGVDTVANDAISWQAKSVWQHVAQITQPPPSYISLVNVAPTLDTTHTPHFALGKEATIWSLVAPVADDANDNRLGLAVTGLDTSHGKWQWGMYDTFQGTYTWSDITGVSATSALLLDPDASLRFVADSTGFTGSADLTFRVWDMSHGWNGDRWDTTVNGGDSPFSANTGTVRAGGTFTDAQVAPELSPPTYGLPTFMGNQRVSNLLYGQAWDLNWDPLGIAITQVDVSGGSWEWGVFNQNLGTYTWKAISGVSESNALLLSPDMAVRFVDDSTPTTAANLTFRVWDQTSGSAGVSGDTTTNGGATAFSGSISSVSFSGDVYAFNQAPQLSTWGHPQLVHDQDYAVAALLGGYAWDFDYDDLGMAVTAADEANGDWQWGAYDTTSGYFFWTDINSGNLSSTNALVLKSDSYLRFIPLDGFTGTANLSFKAWDGYGYTGAVGGTVDAQNGGGSSAFSFNASFIQSSASVFSAGNHAPEVNSFASPSLYFYTNNPGMTVSKLMVNAWDQDLDDLGIAVSAYTTGSGGGGVWQWGVYDPYANTTQWTNFSSLGTDVLLRLAPDVLVRFNATDANNLGAPTLTFRAWDMYDLDPSGTTATIVVVGGGTSYSDTTVTATLQNFTNTNTPPVLDTSYTPVIAERGATRVSALLDDSSNDVDGAILGIAVTAVDTSHGKWEWGRYDPTLGYEWQTITAPSTTSALLLGPDSLLRFQPNAGYTGTATISYKAWEWVQSSVGLSFNSTDTGLASSFSTDIETATVTVSGARDDHAQITIGAGSISSGGAVYGKLETYGDHDWYAITLAANTKYVFDAVGRALADPYLYLRDDNGVLLASDDDSGDGDDARIVYQVGEKGGLYYLDVGAFRDGFLGDYTLVANPYSFTDDYGQSTLTSGTLAISTMTGSAVQSLGDRDWFSINLNANTAYAFEVKGVSLGDPDLYLRDENGLQLGYGDNYNSTTDAQIIYTPTVAGTYYLDVGGVGESIGSYTVTVKPSVAQTDDRPGDATSVNGVSVGGGSVSGDIETGFDRDWLPVSLTSGTNYIFSVIGSGLNDPDLYLRSGTGTEIAYSDDVTGYAPRIIYTATSTGTHYLDVGGYGANTGNYFVTADAFASPADVVGDTTGSAVGLNTSSFSNSVINSAGDHDWFSVTLNASTSYVFDVVGNTLADPYLTLRDSGGSAVAWDNDGGDGMDSRIIFNPGSSAGTYYLDVQCWNGDLGSYWLYGATITNSGTANNEFLMAGVGATTLTGGGGADIFNFAGTGVGSFNDVTLADVITDFSETDQDEIFLGYEGFGSISTLVEGTNYFEIAWSGSSNAALNADLANKDGNIVTALKSAYPGLSSNTDYVAFLTFTDNAGGEDTANYLLYDDSVTSSGMTVLAKMNVAAAGISADDFTIDHM